MYDADEARDLDLATDADRFLDEEALEPEPPYSEERSIWDDAEVIHAYPRKEAIADGTLHDVTPIALSVGFRLPVAVSSGAWLAFARVPAPTAKASRASLSGPPRAIRRAERREARESRNVRRWARQAERAAAAAKGARERRRVRVLLRALVCAIRAGKTSGGRAAVAVFQTPVGTIAFDISDPALFSVGATDHEGEGVELLAEVHGGDAGEPVITIMEPRER